MDVWTSYSGRRHSAQVCPGGFELRSKIRRLFCGEVRTERRITTDDLAETTDWLAQSGEECNKHEGLKNRMSVGRRTGYRRTPASVDRAPSVFTHEPSLFSFKEKRGWAETGFQQFSTCSSSLRFRDHLSHRSPTQLTRMAAGPRGQRPEGSSMKEMKG